MKPLFIVIYCEQKITKVYIYCHYFPLKYRSCLETPSYRKGTHQAIIGFLIQFSIVLATHL